MKICQGFIGTEKMISIIHQLSLLLLPIEKKDKKIRESL